MRLPHQLKFSVLPELLAVCRFDADAPVPAWAWASDFFCIARTSDELSVVCSEDALDNALPRVAVVERGWTALKLNGPFPFAMTGVLASFLDPLAAAKIPIFAISTFDTDYVLVKHETLEKALLALREAGHLEQVEPPA